MLISLTCYNVLYIVEYNSQLPYEFGLSLEYACSLCDFITVSISSFVTRGGLSDAGLFPILAVSPARHSARVLRPFIHCRVYCREKFQRQAVQHSRASKGWNCSP